LVARVTDSAGSPATADSGVLSLVIDVAATGALTILTTTLPNGKRGVAYSTTVAATGGTPPYAWVEVAPYNVWPTGIDLVGVTNVIAGTPTVFHSKDMRLRVTDSAPVPASVDSGLLTIIIDQVDDVAVTTSALPSGEVNTAYAFTLAATGGYGALTWTKVAGDYPTASPAFALSSAGVLAGTPTAVSTAVLTFRATDSEGRWGERTFTLNVVAEGTAEGPQDFFTTLVASPEHWRSYTLRSTASLNTVVSRNDPVEYAYIYDLGTDTYAAPQDAVKFSFAGKAIANKPGEYTASSEAQLNMTLAHHSTGLYIKHPDTALLIFDVFWTESLRLVVEQSWLNIWKCYRPQLGGKRTWTMMCSPQPQTNPGPEYLGRQWDSMGGTGSSYLETPLKSPEGLIRREPWEPTNSPINQLSGSPNAFWMKHSVWTRYWIEYRYLRDPAEFTSWTSNILQRDPVLFPLAPSGISTINGNWHMVSTWMADETRDPVKILNRVPTGHDADKGTDYWLTNFNSEHNSSQQGPYPIPMPIEGYMRNVVLLNLGPNAYADDTDETLFRRPVR
jgi:hypothetical protein